MALAVSGLVSGPVSGPEALGLDSDLAAVTCQTCRMHKVRQMRQMRKMVASRERQETPSVAEIHSPHPAEMDGSAETAAICFAATKAGRPTREGRR